MNHLEEARKALTWDSALEVEPDAAWAQAHALIDIAESLRAITSHLNELQWNTASKLGGG